MLSRCLSLRINSSADSAVSRDIPLDVSLPRGLLKVGRPPRASSIPTSELSAVTLLTGQGLPASTPATIAPHYVVPAASITSLAAEISITSSIPSGLSITSTSSDQIVPVTPTPSYSSLSTISQSSVSTSTGFLSTPSATDVITVTPATDTTLLTLTTSSTITLSTALSPSTNTSKPPKESATSLTEEISINFHAKQIGKWAGIGAGIVSFLLIVSVIAFFLLRRSKRNRALEPEPEYGFIGGHELTLKRQAEAQARSPYVPPRRKSKKRRAHLESWKGGTVIDAKEEEAAEKALKEKEKREAKKAQEHDDEEPIRGPLKVVNPDGVSLMESDEDDADGRNPATVDQWGNSTQKAGGDVIRPQDVGVALTR